MPRFLADFLRKTPLTGSTDAYFIFTSGGYCGVSGVLANHLMRKKGLRYKGCAELTMPRNYIANDHYPELGIPGIERRIQTASEAIDAIAGAIARGEPLHSRHVWLFELLITLPFTPVYCRVKLGVSDFHATDGCIGCGKCARLCPPEHDSDRRRQARLERKELRALHVLYSELPGGGHRVRANHTE